MPLLTITSPGVYWVDTDYTATSATDDAVVVNSGVHNVTIILTSRLVCPSTFTTARQNAGIRLNGSNSVNVIGLGGHIRGYGFGLRADNCDSLRITHLTVEDALMRGIKTIGAHTIIKDCLIKNIFGSTFTTNQYCFGIECSGAHPTLIGNNVYNFKGTGTGEGVGYSITDDGTEATVAFNISRNPSAVSSSFGFWIGGDSDVSFVHNHAENMTYGVVASSPPTGLIDESTFRGCGTNITDSGGDFTIGGVDG